MTLKAVPPRVRAHLYLFWFGMACAGLGVLGFILSFWRVGSAAAAVVDVHETVPVFAYASIAAWVVGLAVMWYSRRWLNAAVDARMRERSEGMFVAYDRTAITQDDTSAGATAGRDD